MNFLYIFYKNHQISDFIKIRNAKANANPQVGMMSLIVSFRYFAKASKNYYNLTKTRETLEKAKKGIRCGISVTQTVEYSITVRKTHTYTNKTSAKHSHCLKPERKIMPLRAVSLLC